MQPMWRELFTVISRQNIGPMPHKRNPSEPDLMELYRKLSKDQQALLTDILEDRIDGKLTAMEFVDKLRQIPLQDSSD